MPPRYYVVLATALVAVCSPASAIVITHVGTAYTQDFNTLATTGTGTALPPDWAIAESPSLNTTYTAGTGSWNAGDSYSFGASGSTERALGSLQSGSLVPSFGVFFTNGTGGLIDALDVDYVGEQWRLGAAGRVDRLDFQYSMDASSLITGTWVDVDGLDFASPTTAGATGALNGNAAANRMSLTMSITGLALLDGSSVWFRWTDFNASGADDGLAIDDFSLTARAPATVPSQSVPDSLPMAAALGIVLAGLAAVRGSVPAFERAA